MGLAHVVGTEAGPHRSHTLAFPGKQQAGAIGLQRDHAIQVPRGLRQAIQIGREAFLLGAWRNRMGAHDQQLNIQEWQTGWSFSSRYPVYNTVVVERRSLKRRESENPPKQSLDGAPASLFPNVEISVTLAPGLSLVVLLHSPAVIAVRLQ